MARRYQRLAVAFSPRDHGEDWVPSPLGPRVWDLAYLAYRLVPLTEPGNVEAGSVDPARRAARLSLLCDAYGAGPRPADVLRAAVERLHALADFTEARADDGNEHLRSHVDFYRRDAAWIAATSAVGPSAT
jgi:hypothetical protein